MELKGQTEGADVLVVALRVDNLHASNVHEFRDAVQALIGEHSRVVLGLSGVKFLDSSGLGSPISCLRQLNGRRGDFRLCGLSPTVQALFELMRLQRVFRIFGTRPEAVASFE